MHGGSVVARSDGAGRGSEFLIRLPVVATQPATRGAARSALAIPPRRVLVIEDNLDTAETLQEVLLAWDHEVAVAHDGREGVEKVRAFRPDVVLCDVGLPVMDGYERRARDPRRSGARVGRSGRDDRVRAPRRRARAAGKPGSTGTSASRCQSNASKRSWRLSRESSCWSRWPLDPSPRKTPPPGRRRSLASFPRGDGILLFSPPPAPGGHGRFSRTEDRLHGPITVEQFTTPGARLRRR